jgi:hypothetical protein
MYQILYKSDNQISQDSFGDEIKKILTKSSANNLQDGITGLFLLVENRFIQLLEGEEENVKKCYQRIQSDNRHGNLTTLLQRNIGYRLFPHWSMRFLSADKAEDLENLGISKLKDLGISKWEESYKDNLAILFMECFARLSASQSEID